MIVFSLILLIAGAIFLVMYLALENKRSTKPTLTGFVGFVHNLFSALYRKTESLFTKRAEERRYIDQINNLQGKVNLRIQQLQEKQVEINTLKTQISERDSKIRTISVELATIQNEFNRIYEISLTKCVLSEYVANTFCNKFEHIIYLIESFEDNLYARFCQCKTFADNKKALLLLDIAAEYIRENRLISNDCLEWYTQAKYTSSISGNLAVDLTNKTSDKAKLLFLNTNVFEKYYKPRIGNLFLFAEKFRAISMNSDIESQISTIISTCIDEFLKCDIEVVYVKVSESVPNEMFDKIEIRDPLTSDLVEKNIVLAIDRFGVNSSSMSVIKEKTILEMKI